MEEESKIILYTTPDGKSRVSLMSRDGRVWLNQKQMAELFAVSKPNVSMLIAKILKEKELDDSVVKCYLTTAADGKKYKVIYYALEMILAVGFRVRGVRGTQFRQWRCRTSGTMRLMSGGSKRRLVLLTRLIWQSSEGLKRKLKNEDELVAKER